MEQTAAFHRVTCCAAPRRHRRPPLSTPTASSACSRLAGCRGTVAGGCRQDESYLARNPGASPSPHHHDLNNAASAPAPRGPRGVSSAISTSPTSRRVPHVQDPRADIESVRALAREFGCDPEDWPSPQRQRVAPDRAARIDLKRRRGVDHRSGLPAHADDVGAAGAPRRDQADQDHFPGPPRPASTWPTCSSRPSRAHEVILLCQITISPARSSRRARSAAWPRARHQDDRRRRARLRALPLRGPRLECDYYGSACTKCSRTNRHGLLYFGGRTSRASGRMQPAAAAGRQNPQVRGDRHAPGRNHNAIAEALSSCAASDRAEGRAPALLKNRWRAPEKIPACASTRLSTPRSPAARERRLDAVDCQKLGEHLWTKFRVIVVPSSATTTRASASHQRVHHAR